MEQKSNVQYRAEKEYKNSREKFFLLLREIISNAICPFFEPLKINVNQCYKIM